MADAAETSASTVRYKGVRKRKWGKWVSEVRLPNSRERIWLGSYDSPEKAARAFDAGSFLLRGDRASLNFPDRKQEIAIYCSRRNPTPQQIQAAAARYAHADLPALSQPWPPVSQAAEDSTPSQTMCQWEVMEHLMDTTFPGIDEFQYDLFHQEEHLEQMDFDMESSWEDSAHSSSLWNF
uniref:Ethylene-responsive transcription factor ERF-like protein n=1 Tax=Cymbidium sinense TaxID=112615 RepID=A0A455LAK5_9ASPA|nr:ethylene-responsive transcription factor ERF-like protein [Cymbidium sinense]